MENTAIGHKTDFVLTKRKVGEAKPYEIEKWSGNIGLNEGLGEFLDLACGLGTPTPFDSVNAYIGVGDGEAAASATQTGLQGINKDYQGMEAGYPSRSGTSVTFKSIFGPDDALFVWKEFTVANGSSDTAKNLFRKVHVRDEKLEGEEWTMEITITLA